MERKRKLKYIPREELELLLSYKDKEVYCIKYMFQKGYGMPPVPYDISIQKGDYYKIRDVKFHIEDNIIGSPNINVLDYLDNDAEYSKVGEYVLLIECGKMGFNYTSFLKHFELATIEEVRIRKIKNLLEE